MHSYLLVWTPPHSYLLTSYPKSYFSHLLIYGHMSSVRWNCVMSCLITFPQYFFGLSLPLLKLSIGNRSHLRNGSVHLLITCSNNFNHTSLMLCSTEVTPTLTQISSFIIISLLVYLHIHCNILIFDTFIFYMWQLLTGQHSFPQIIIGLTTTLYNLPLCFGDTYHTRLRIRAFISFTLHQYSEWHPCQSPYFS